MAPASLLMSASESAFPSSQAELEFDFQVQFHSIAMLKQLRAQSADFEVHALAQWHRLLALWAGAVCYFP